MPTYLHSLPTEAQATGIDHAALLKEIREDNFIHYEVKYGEVVDGEFDPHPAFEGPGRAEKVVIDNLDDFLAFASVNENVPDQARDSMQHLDKDIAAYADANELWHTYHWE